MASSPPSPTHPRRSDYRGLIVDWGGVMTTNVFDTFRAFCRVEGLCAETVGESLRRHAGSRALLIGLEDGSLPEHEFEPRFAEILGVSAPGLIDRLFAGGSLDEAMLAAVAAARAAGIRTGLISNSWGTGRYDRELLQRLFDGVVISGEVGMRKPSAEIYVLGAGAVELPPERCVFVDDLGPNLKPASALGMATVLHADSQQTIAELEARLGVELR